MIKGRPENCLRSMTLSTYNGTYAIWNLTMGGGNLTLYEWAFLSVLRIGILKILESRMSESFCHYQCDQLGRFIAAPASFKSLRVHFVGQFLKGVFHFSSEHFLGNFIKDIGRHFTQTFWSPWSLFNLPTFIDPLRYEVLFQLQRLWKISWEEESP